LNGGREDKGYVSNVKITLLLLLSMAQRLPPSLVYRVLVKWPPPTSLPPLP